MILHVELVLETIDLKYLGVWVNSQLRWKPHIQECCWACLDRLRLLHWLYATYWGLHPGVVSVLVWTIVFLKRFYGVSAWGGVVHFQVRLLPINRVLRQAAILTLGLLHMISCPKVLAVCELLPANMEICYALV